MSSTGQAITNSASADTIDLLANKITISPFSDKVHTMQDNTHGESIDNTISLKQWQSRMPQKFIVVWLDPNINESDDKYYDSIIQLRRIVNTVQIFTEADQCIDFITNVGDSKFFLILSNNVGVTTVSLINDMPQVDSIYIFCNENTKSEQRASEWRKVKGIFDDISAIFDQLQQNFRHYEQDLISTNIFSLGSGLDLDELDQSFMYSVLLKEILLEMNYDEKAKVNFFKSYRDQHTPYQVGVNRINEMEKSYNQHSPIWWYKKEPFIYSILNTALRTQNITTIIEMGFYLKDLHQQIEQVHSKVNQVEKLVIYRGQNMSNDEFEKMKKNKGGLLSFNNFLSTTVDRDIALSFAEGARNYPHLTGILFDMEIDPSMSKTPFAPLKLVNDWSASEDEILFSMHTIFRIGEMKEISNQLWNVKLIMTSDTDTQLELLTNRIREEIQGPNELHRLGNLLVKMGQFDKAEETYNTLLEMLSDDDSNKLAYIYNQLGNILNEKGHLEKALSYLEKTLEIRCKSLPCNHPDLATTYNHIGLVYDNMGNYSKALSCYEKTLEIRQQTLPSNHPDLATIYNNIGSVYDNMGNYSKALSYYQKTLEIRQTILPSNHPDLAITYNNMGLVYVNMGEYSKALSCYEKTLEIRQKTLPSNHPSLASSYNNIGSVHQTMGDYPTALSYFKKTVEIQQETLPSNHPDLATTYNNIGWVYHSMGEYSIALSSLQKSLRIRQVSLPPNHPHLATTYNTIGLVYNSMAKYSEGLSYFEKTLDIFQSTLPPNHPSHADTYNNIGSVYQAMGDYPKAHFYYDKTLQIRQQTLPDNHPDLAVTYNNIGSICNSMGEYSKALSYYEKTLQIQQKSLPSNHPSFADTYNNIGRVHNSMNDYLNAIPHYKKALKIQQAALSSDHPSLAITYNNIGRTHAATEHYSYALQYYKDALKIQEKVLPSNHPSLAETYNNVGEMYRLTGDCAAALTYFDKSLKIQKIVLPSDHPSLAITYSNIGQAHYSMKKFQRASSDLEKTLEIQAKSLSSNHPLLAKSHYIMATILQGLHRYSEAIAHASQAVDIISHSIEPNHSQAEKYQKYFNELSEMTGGEAMEKKKVTEQWTYPVLLVLPSLQDSRLYSILKNITDGGLMLPVQADQCIDKLQSDQKIKDLIFEVSSVSDDRRDCILKAVSSFDGIESIYLLGKPPETKKQRNELFTNFNKICIFCEDEEQLAVQWVLNMASDCRTAGNQCTETGDKAVAREHFQRGIDLYDRLNIFIDSTRRKMP